MSGWSWAFALVLAGGVALASWWLARPVVRHGVRREDLGRFFESLLNEIRPEGILFIEDEGSEAFLQFRHRFRRGRSTVHFGFPDAPWSRSVWQPLAAALQEAGFGYQVRPTHEEPVRRFLTVDDVDTSDEAARLAAVALTALGIAEDAPLRLRIQGELDLKAFRRRPARTGPDAAEREDDGEA